MAKPARGPAWPGPRGPATLLLAPGHAPHGPGPALAPPRPRHGNGPERQGRRAHLGRGAPPLDREGSAARHPNKHRRVAPHRRVRAIIFSRREGPHVPPSGPSRSLPLLLAVVGHVPPPGPVARAGVGHHVAPCSILLHGLAAARRTWRRRRVPPQVAPPSPGAKHTPPLNTLLHALQYTNKHYLRLIFKTEKHWRVKGI